MSRSPSQFAVPSAPPVAEVVRLLSDRLGAVEEPVRSETRAVLDSADCCLRDAGLVLEVVRAGHARTTAVIRPWGRAPEDHAVPMEQTPSAARDLPPRLHTKLAPILDDRELRTVGAVDVDVHPLAVRDASDKTILRAFVDVTRSGTWVRLAPVRGYPRAAARADRAIAQLGLRPDAELVETIYPPADPEPAAANAAAVWVAVLREQLDQMLAHLPGALAGDDIEELHDLRVAVRRTRSALRHGTDVLPAELIACFRPELTRFQRATGESRDLDVLLADVEAMEDPALEPLVVLIRSRLEDARRLLLDGLRSDETDALLDDWLGTLDALVAVTEGEEADEWGRWPADAHRSVSDVVAERIRHQRARMLKRGKAISKDSMPDQFHDLRKHAKELRYLHELFGDHVSELASPNVVARLKGLQDVLGRYQDLTVQHARLQQLERELDPDARPAVRALLERLEREQHDDRQKFARRFKKFAAAIHDNEGSG